MHKKLKITYSKERVLLSETLPYETPLSFSNRRFYEFVKKHNIEFRNNKFRWDTTCLGNTAIIKIVLGLSNGMAVEDIIDGKSEIKEVLTGGALSSIPFCFSITKNETQSRELSIVHPRNQVIAVSFYHENREAILYNCSKSNFSIRYPHSIAKCIYWKDGLKYIKEDDEFSVESYNRELKSLRSFFTYKSFSNIYKFYDSEIFLENEKKFNQLNKLDISNCFGSLYTHSVAWAVLGKMATKHALTTGKHSQLGQTFPGIFDSFMQNVNYQETNGIVVGPEFSRIFSEIILQNIDTTLENNLKKKKLIFGENYSVYRYVDDYFVFYNTEDDFKMIRNSLQHLLKKYKLYINEKKQHTYCKPIVTNITIAKEKIKILLNNSILYEIEESEITHNNETKGIFRNEKTPYLKNIITEFKIILKTSDVTYHEILNYTLMVAETLLKKCQKNFMKSDASLREVGLEADIVKFQVFTSSILNFAFFISSVSPRVNNTIRLSRILWLSINFFLTQESTKSVRHLIFRQVFENICLMLQKNRIKEYSQIESSYLLLVISTLGKEYWLDEHILSEYLGFVINEETKLYEPSYELNYFSITILLYYIKRKKRFSRLKAAICEHVKLLFNDSPELLRKTAEKTMLLLDLLACPYLDNEIKKYLLTKMEVETPSVQDSILSVLPDHFFSKWRSLDLTKELDAKRSLEVY